MKGISSKDLMLIFVLASITAIFTSTMPLNIFTLDIAFFVMSIVLSGYSLMAIIYPEEDATGLLKKPFLIVMFSVFMAILISLMLKTLPLRLHFKDLTWFLSLITALLSITAIFVRITQIRQIEETEKSVQKLVPLSFRDMLDKNLIIFSLLSLILIITVLVPPLNKTPAWMLPGSLFVCLIPGYLLLEIMFPRNDDLELIERLALSFGSSLILTSIIGLIFNYTQWGIRLELILLVIAVFCLFLCFITLARRKKLPLGLRISIPSMEKMLSIFLIICILMTVGAAAYTLLKPGSTPGKDNKTNLTDFYIKKIDSNASAYTLNLVSGEETTLNMILVNQEGSAVNYNILVRVNNSILKQDNITLQNNQKMKIPVNFTAGLPGEKNIEFILYKPPNKNPYQKKIVKLKVT
ncbi:MAG TPA: DUF1616 domain-containing protein [Methanobacterium sp.]|nr:DUF1616 domain-containing protein [Methanobacterium sp.]